MNLVIKQIKTMDKCLSEILEAIGIDFNEFETNFDKLYAKRIKSMIADAESIATDLHDANDFKDNDKTMLNVANAAIALRNAYKFDKNDAKLVSKQDVTNLIKAIETIDKELHRFCYYLCSNLHAIEKCHEEDDKDDKDDLESLSKEELITRLREKSK